MFSLIDIAIPSDRNVIQKESEKKLKYKNSSTLLPGYNAGLRGRDLTRVIRQPRYNRRLQLFFNSVIL
jgi:hypothetical protein